MADWLAAIILGLVEGLTEFIPVSSTGHLLLTQHLLGLNDPRWSSFVVLIQLGAILAVVALYFQRLWGVLIRLPTDPKARHFAISVLVAFIPSLLAGAFLYDFIKAFLFESLATICVSLIVGGFVLLALERFAPKPHTGDAMALSWRQSVLVGLFQCLSLVPGVSRSGATIAGGLVLGLEKPAAAEFSFFLAIPTMVGAFTYDLIKDGGAIDMNFAWIIAIGFVVSFLSGLLVIRWMLGFVARHGFTPFAWWRIAVGLAGLAALYGGVLA
ncbi:UDP pyrophosphate phosphatase [Brevundimonas sp. Leaf363]|uniref:undecaprenyl-diphosphate phosphatase n=1 Tax=Brevundimonas sp. Leaf363 TaxID=1736353 RepID=UPI0006F53659|nr:undecaprenyl-diphosphate phosphatase [Brevundimonas sp. Leaf363]KQS57215.1 UDP pyrophosphate phosphatase [Brevundimonas sp. Leaf363]